MYFIFVDEAEKEKQALVVRLKDLVCEAREKGVYLGDVLAEILKEEGADNEFEHILSRQMMGPDRESAVKGYLFAVQYAESRRHFITYKGDAQAIAGLLSLISSEITRRDDVGIFVARLVGTALQESEEILSH